MQQCCLSGDERLLQGSCLQGVNIGAGTMYPDHPVKILVLLCFRTPDLILEPAKTQVVGEETAGFHCDSAKGAREIQHMGNSKYLQATPTAKIPLANLGYSPVYGNYLGGSLQHTSHRAPRETKNDRARLMKVKAYTLKTGYSSLPGEIRNRVMWFALVPGEVSRHT